MHSRSNKSRFESVEEAMAAVEEICKENDIDLDDESEMACSQTNRNDLLIDDDDAPLEDLIGIVTLTRSRLH